MATPRKTIPKSTRAAGSKAVTSGGANAPQSRRADGTAHGSFSANESTESGPDGADQDSDPNIGEESAVDASEMTNTSGEPSKRGKLQNALTWAASAQGTATMALGKSIEAIAKVQNRLQFGLLVLALVVILVLWVRVDTPPIALLLALSSVPLILALPLIDDKFTQVRRMTMIMTIELMALAFLGTGIALAVVDRTLEHHAEFRSKHYERIQQKLDYHYVTGLEPMYPTVRNYSDYRKLVLDLYAQDNSEHVLSGIDQLTTFYEDYILCRSRLACFGSESMDHQIVAFWYSFRPIVEEARLGVHGTRYAASIQRFAEGIQPPRYLSQVKCDPATGRTELVNTADQFDTVYHRVKSLVGLS